MGKVKRPTDYFQFPICLLSVPGTEREVAGHIISWHMVNRGRALWQKGGGEVARQRIEQLREWGKLTNFSEHDENQIAAVVCTLELQTWLASFSYISHMYAKAEAHCQRYRRLAGVKSKTVRIRSDLMWKLWGDEPGGFSLREFRVLAGLYSAIGGNSRRWVSNTWLRYLAAGCNKQEDYERLEAERRVAAVDLNALDWPDLPEGFRSSQSNNKARGYFRYDEALAYWRLLGGEEAGVPLTGEEGMFSVHLSSRGAIFSLRASYWPRDGSSPLTGRTDPHELYSAGEEVVFFYRQRLCVGVIEEVGRTHIVIVGSDGTRYENVARGSAFITPAHFFKERLQEAEQQAAEVTEPDLLLTDHKLRKTLDDLEAMGLFVRYRKSKQRGSYCYSHKASKQQLIQGVLKGEEVRLEKKIRSQEAEIEELSRLEELRAKSAANAARLRELKEAKQTASQAAPVSRRERVDGAPAPVADRVSTAPIIESLSIERPHTERQGGVERQQQQLLPGRAPTDHESALTRAAAPVVVEEKRGEKETKTTVPAQLPIQQLSLFSAQGVVPSANQVPSSNGVAPLHKTDAGKGGKAEGKVSGESSTDLSAPNVTATLPDQNEVRSIGEVLSGLKENQAAPAAPVREMKQPGVYSYLEAVAIWEANGGGEDFPLTDSSGKPGLFEVVSRPGRAALFRVKDEHAAQVRGSVNLKDPWRCFQRGQRVATPAGTGVVVLARPDRVFVEMDASSDVPGFDLRDVVPVDVLGETA